MLFIDIETSPLVCYTWGIGDQNIGINQIVENPTVLSVAAKWQGSNEIMYLDTRNKQNPRNDLEVCKFAFDLLNEAQVVVAQNGKRFDSKVLAGRFAINNLGSPSPFQQVDTLQIARKHFKLPSYKLEYMCTVFGLNNKKLKSKKFIGMDLWRECLNKNPEAWKEMELYNKHDVFALEELYEFLLPYGIGIDLSIYNGKDEKKTCNCGSSKLKKEGFRYTKTGKFQQFSCKVCGSWMSSKTNLLTKQDKAEILKKD